MFELYAETLKVPKRRKETGTSDFATFACEMKGTECFYFKNIKVNLSFQRIQYFCH